ncbi:uncharacterized protein LOC128217285 isoform X2 [Mya arenaria]|uniref:uncharacterized protein LOC128217285 isoform X2 n=1 Tax=Mya arenaria TaxID=6604 RepID=UPI0022E62BE0|nr:uncharacterized protein LOC128217285 isoform X2 [Mya arenaria]
MEIYVAISDFTPPIVDGSQNILQFEKGDQFEIFDCHKTDADWWGARALKTNTVGYVPSRYMQYEERRVGKLLPNNYKSEKECSLKKLTAIQNDPNQKSPEDMYSEQEEPEPDYHDEADSALQDEPVRGRAERSSSQSSENGQTGSRKPQNPCIESPTRMALHKELLLNYKRGVNVLEKPELNKVLQNRRETQRRKEWDDQKKMSTKRTSFEMKLEERANRMKEDEMSAINEEPTKDQPEFQKIFTKIKSKSNGAVK